MGFDFIKEVDKNLSKMVTNKRFSPGRRLSEDLPENIKEIDRVVGEAIGDVALKLDGPIKEFTEKLVRLLRSKGVMPEWDVDDLALKVLDRFINRKHSWDFGARERYAKSLAVYENNKDRSCVKRIVDLTGTTNIPDEALSVISWIELIDSKRAEGKSYPEIASELYQDHPSCVLAFISHLEEANTTTVTTVKQFQELIENAYDDKTAESLLYIAFEERYRFALERILREGGKYPQLVALDPKDFHLPEVWFGMFESTTKHNVIHNVIYSCFKFDNEITRISPSIRDIANLIEAPYTEVLKASRYWNVLFS